MRQALTFMLFVFYLWSFQFAWSQDVTAAITCSVVDPAGASIVAASFTAKDTERTTVYTVQTIKVFSTCRACLSGPTIL